MAKRIRATEELEGFLLQNDSWFCEWNTGSPDEPKMCGKPYVVKWRAEQHLGSHKEHQKVLEQAKKFQVQESTGGDLLREIAQQIGQGFININELIVKLNVAAKVVDSLTTEIRTSNMRELTRKAKAWDSLVEALPSIPDVFELLQEAGKVSNGHATVEG